MFLRIIITKSASQTQCSKKRAEPINRPPGPPRRAAPSWITRTHGLTRVLYQCSVCQINPNVLYQCYIPAAPPTPIRRFSFRPRYLLHQPTTHPTSATHRRPAVTSTGKLLYSVFLLFSSSSVLFRAPAVTSTGDFVFRLFPFHSISFHFTSFHFTPFCCHFLCSIFFFLQF